MSDQHRPAHKPPRLFLGCPVWACEHWKGSLFTAKAPRADWLGQYSSVFQTVEGNSTFYALPSLETAKRWADSVQSGFRFALKVPRSISHDCRLKNAQKELAAFIDVCHVLEAHKVLGPSFLQLPPDFSPAEKESLQHFLTALPAHLPWAVEVRHQDWYDSAKNEEWLDGLLKYLRMDKVIFDSRCLFSKPPSDAVEEVSQARKPRTPIRTTVTSQHPFLRIVGRNQLDETQRWIEEWAPIIADWLRQGLEPFLFTHAPDDQFAPEFARRMHHAIRSHFPELPEMPKWPGEIQSTASRQQKTLF